MEQITLRIPTRTLAEIERDASEHDRTRSEHIRDLLESHNEHTEHAEALRGEIEHLETENDRLERRIAALLDRQEERGELVAFAQNRREIERVERERRQARESANVLTRARWFLFGRDEE